MGVKAIFQGAMVGVAVALIMAMLLAIVDYHSQLPGRWYTVMIWVGSAITSGAAGYMAGLKAEAAGWFHGFLAAATLNLVATAMAETLGRSGIHHFWMGLGVSVAAGMVGGLIGAGNQY